ncbi:rarD protein [Pseudomonas amygdali pv. aesculi str. 0893_23]|nr:rarD protein [Pseudomonas amygdali pv. aesculi str. 0893_23]
MQAANPRRGYILGLSAYTIWGLSPIYFKAISAVPAIEIIIHRVLWSALFGSIVLMFWKHPGWWRDLRNNPQRLAVLALSGTLIAANWIVYVWAVNNGRMLEASLGYYINPLVNVLLGMLLLGERLRRLQMLAVAFATIGVAQQVWNVGSLPWVSLALALTFAFYGLIRKKAPVAALPGLVVETWMLVPLALIWLTLNPTAVSAGVLQRRSPSPALHHPGFPAIPRAHAGSAAGGAAVWGAPDHQHHHHLRLHLGGAGNLQCGYLAEIPQPRLIKKHTTPRKPRPPWPARGSPRVIHRQANLICAQAIETVGFLINFRQPTANVACKAIPPGYPQAHARLTWIT